MKKLLINNQQAVFDYSDSAHVWSGTVSLWGMNISIEIDLDDLPRHKINWETVSNFLNDLGKQMVFPSNLDKSQTLLKHFIQIVPHGIETPERTELYQFKLEAILYKGTSQSRITTNDNAHKYEFLWKLYHEKYPECYDPYGNYLIQVEDTLIIGIRRDQV
jgi:hypothetical protein